MNDGELRAAMDHAVAVALPPMREEPVLTAGRRALTRRRAVRASAGSAAAVAIIAAGVTVLAPSQGHNSEIPVGAPPSATKDTPAPSTSARADATATAGAEYDRAVALAAALDALVPAGYGTPDDLKGAADYANRTLKNHKAMSAGTVNGTEVWYYAAGTPLVKGEGVGELAASVYTPGWATTGKGCGLRPVAWDATRASCVEVDVNGEKVAVADVVYPPQDGLTSAQWAGYRHPDGTVVFVMQSSGVARSGRPDLGTMPMTAQELAATAVDPRLQLR